MNTDIQNRTVWYLEDVSFKIDHVDNSRKSEFNLQICWWYSYNTERSYTYIKKLISDFYAEQDSYLIMNLLRLSISDILIPA